MQRGIVVSAQLMQATSVQHVVTEMATCDECCHEFSALCLCEQVLDLQSTCTQHEGTISEQELAIHDLTTAKSDLEQQLQLQTHAREAAEELSKRIHAQR
jgi:hypothetical protein